MSTLVIILMWLLYSFYEGKREALFFSMKMRAQVTDGNEHPMFMVQRSIVAFMALFLLWYNGMDVYSCAAVLISMGLMFVFVHDGEYYVERNKLDKCYPEGWLDQSTTSTAEADKLKLDTPLLRIIYFMTGAGIAIFEIIHNWK